MSTAFGNSSEAEKSTEASRALLELWHDPLWSSGEELTILEGLCKVGDLSETVVPALIAAIADNEKRTRKNALWALGVIGSQSEAAVLHLIIALADPDESFRPCVAYVLIKIGAPAVPNLIEGLTDTNQAIRRYAAYVLGKIGASAEVAVPALIISLGGPDTILRRDAAEALGSIRFPETLIVPALINALGDSDDKVRECAASSLGKIGIPVVSTLIAALAKSEKAVRVGISSALGHVGHHAVPALTAALNITDGHVRDGAATALGQIGVPAIPALRTALKSPNQAVRESAVYALGKIGPRAEAAVPDLLITLADPDETMRRRTAWTLGKIGRPVEEVVRALIAALADPDDTVPQYALGALVDDIGIQAAPALLTTLTDTNALIREGSARALREIEPRTIAAVQALIAALADPVENVSWHASQTLKSIGEAAIPALNEARRSANSRISRAATKLLAQLDPDSLATEILGKEAPVLSTEERHILNLIEGLSHKQYLRALQVFWCIGIVDRDALESGGTTMPLAELVNRLEQLKPTFAQVPLTYSDGFLRDGCIQAVEGLFDKSEFHACNWSGEEGKIALRVSCTSDRRRKKWTSQARKAWQYVNLYLSINKLEPKMQLPAE